jgi:hypothetical protein
VTQSKLDKNADDIISSLSKRVPFHHVAKRYKTCTETLRTWLKTQNRIQEVLRLMRKLPVGEEHKYMDVSIALEEAEKVGLKVTRATMIQWISKNELGFQPGGPDSLWYVDREKFQAFLDGQK